jgi:outer membrane protein OmpA-like peptidoglycan-associated protein
MGKIFRTSGPGSLKTAFEAIIVLTLLVVLSIGIYWFAPGLRVDSSKKMSGLTLSKDRLDNVTKGTMIPLPSKESAKFTVVNGKKVPSAYNEDLSTKVSSLPLNRIAEYAWNGNVGMLSALGGPRTTKGSLMEASGINLEVVRLDGVTDLRNMLVKFVDEFASGKEYPESDKSAFGVSIMGDGYPFFVATTQQILDDKFGKGKYHVVAVGAIGMSDGEDKVIGPAAWQKNPQLMKGALLSSVVGDGDWVVAVNFAFANGISVNPDVKTYDKDALNFVPSENDDYINSVKELIKSQLTGFTVPLKEVINGKLTGKIINKKIDGATTWTPGDKLAFDALTGFIDVISTKDFTNQMATTLVVVKEWALQHEKIVTTILKNSYVACNQIKQYDEWSIFASKAVCKTYNLETPKYWYEMFKGYKESKASPILDSNGNPKMDNNNKPITTMIEYNVGGSRVLNYSDALQYYGITDGTNRYKAVYDQISKYLTVLNPCGFNESVKSGVIPYEDAVNLYFLKSINDIDAGVTKKADYTQTKSEVLATGEWHINFATNSTAIRTTKELETIYGLLIQAENTKVKIIGYTDNVGNPKSNVTLSKGRANSVKSYLVSKGIPEQRFQVVDGYGDSNPIDSNNTEEGKAKNRRCEITLLK